MSLLFLAKHKPFAEDASELVRLHYYSSAEIIFGDMNSPFPEHLKISAINFHPGPPEYPGIGCTNFAIYNGEKEFGITVHHMQEKVDTGDIIHVERFPIFDNDTVYSLTQRCYAYIYIAFVKIFSIILSDKPLPSSNETWKRKPFTRKELNDLCVITKDMSDDETRRRVRATCYPKARGAFIELAGMRFSADICSEKEGGKNSAKDCIDRRGGARKGLDRLNQGLWGV